jgi:polar amino acid transport system substrate-binding protein
MPISRSRIRGAIAAVAAGALLVTLAACSSSSSTTTTHGLQTMTAGKLTIATGQPAYTPWVEDNKPQNGKGFESAVAYAVAAKLGFSKKEVVWVRTDFDGAIKPGQKDFDFNLQQFTITPDREKAVDFSSPYYTTTQAIVTTAKSPAASVTTIDGLKKLKVGVATGTTSYTVYNDQVGVQPQVFNSNDDAVLALKSGQIDAVVTDLPTAFYIASSQIKNGKVTGQFDETKGGDKFGLLLAKDSPLTKKVTAAVNSLRKDGTLAALTKKWLSTTVDVPVFK